MDTSGKHIPDILTDILKGITPIRSNITELQSGWQRYITDLKTELPEITIKDDSDTVCLASLSPGCRRCKIGEWDCLFVTPDCNLNCQFCISPFQNRRIPISAFGKTPAECIPRYRNAGITGVSFSGGEPFLEFETVAAWLQELKSEFPDNYYWIYTNGILVNREHIDVLSDLGLDEIRFNTAATDYQDPDVMRLIEYAAGKLSSVAVEVPVLRKDHAALREALPDYADAGVTFINLHELMREKNTPSQHLQNESFRTFVLPDGHVTDVSMDSRAVVKELIHTILASNLPLHLNFCSMMNKLRQIRKRRSRMAKVMKNTFENLVDDEYLESIFVFRDKTRHQWLHPNEWNDQKSRFAGQTVFKLKKLAPLSVWDTGRYISAHQLEDEHVVSSASFGKL